jgi:hypothetical protein
MSSELQFLSSQQISSTNVSVFAVDNNPIKNYRKKDIINPNFVIYLNLKRIRVISEFGIVLSQR